MLLIKKFYGFNKIKQITEIYKFFELLKFFRKIKLKKAYHLL